LPIGKLAAVTSVSPAIASGAFVPAGSFACQTTLPFVRSSAQTEPSNVVVKTRSFATVAAPNAGVGKWSVQRIDPDD
jgi:hypothetical protein